MQLSEPAAILLVSAAQAVLLLVVHALESSTRDLWAPRTVINQPAILASNSAILAIWLVCGTAPLWMRSLVAIAIPLIIALTWSVLWAWDTGGLLIWNGRILVPKTGVQYAQVLFLRTGIILTLAVSNGAIIAIAIRGAQSRWGLRLIPRDQVQEDERPPRIQFGLARLMIWVSAVGIALGILRNSQTDSLFTGYFGVSNTDFPIYGLLAAIVTIPFLVMASFRNQFAVHLLDAIVFAFLVGSATFFITNLLQDAGTAFDMATSVAIVHPTYLLLSLFSLRVAGWRLEAGPTGPPALPVPLLHQKP
jgi:hypothetical protein